MTLFFFSFTCIAMTFFLLIGGFTDTNADGLMESTVYDLSQMSANHGSFSLLDTNH